MQGRSAGRSARDTPRGPLRLKRIPCPTAAMRLGWPTGKSSEQQPASCRDRRTDADLIACISGTASSQLAPVDRVVAVSGDNRPVSDWDGARPAFPRYMPRATPSCGPLRPFATLWQPLVDPAIGSQSGAARVALYASIQGFTNELQTCNSARTACWTDDWGTPTLYRCRSCALPMVKVRAQRVATMRTVRHHANGR
jgi:hypothetical protein